MGLAIAETRAFCAHVQAQRSLQVCSRKFHQGERRWVLEKLNTVKSKQAVFLEAGMECCGNSNMSGKNTLVVSACCVCVCACVHVCVEEDE